MKWGYKFYQSRVFVFEERLCVILRVGWFCLFESRVRILSKLRLLGIFKVRLRIPSKLRMLGIFKVRFRILSKLRLLGIFKVRLRIPSEVRTLSRLRGYIFPRRAGGLCMWVIFCAINFKIFLREGKKYSFLTEY